MRIDYSEPRQSYGSSPSPAPRKAASSSGSGLWTFVLLGGVLFFIGFGSGWYLSQKSAKKAFRAAMEQQSLESVLKDSKPQQPLQPAATVPAAPQATQPPQPPQQAAPTGQVPLSFFESLPKGQKQTVLGSGINEKTKPAPAATPPTAQPTPAVPKAADAKTANTGYVVQVAAFNSLKEAEAAKARLSSKGYSASISEININDKGVWYRVRIGRHLEKESAAEIASRIGGGAKILPDLE